MPQYRAGLLFGNFLFISTVFAGLLAIPKPDRALKITASGTYNLDRNIVSATTPILIEVDDVVLNLNGHSVTCKPSDPSKAITFGINAADRKNIHISNGKITGCFYGIQMVSASHSSVSGVDFSGNTYIGINIQSSNDVKITNSMFAGIRGYALEPYAIGINGVGKRSSIEKNRFHDLDRQENARAGQQGEGVAILVSAGAEDSDIRGNWIENEDGSMETIGIWVADGTSGISIAENNLTNVRRGIVGYTGKASSNRLMMHNAKVGSTAISLSKGETDSNVVIGYE